MKDTWFFTDIHGNWNLFNKIMRMIPQDDTIVFGGDACDRGDDGFMIMSLLSNNLRTIYLKGNHEQMFVNAARAIINENGGKHNIKNPDVYKIFEKAEDNPDVRLSVYNGGMRTLLDWIQAGMKMNIIQEMENLPLTYSYEYMDFCHAGGVYPVFYRTADAEYSGKAIDPYDEHDILWNRNAMAYGWQNNRVCIYGHTPVASLPSRFHLGHGDLDTNPIPIVYIGDFDDKFTGKKVDMDAGTYYSNKAFLLNCTTRKVYIFNTKDNKYITKQLDI